jgi:hypothetical protein
MVKLFVPLLLAPSALSTSLAFHTISTPYRVASLVQGNDYSITKRWKKSITLRSALSTSRQPAREESRLFLAGHHKDCAPVGVIKPIRDELIIDAIVVDELCVDASNKLQRISWISWWSQAILSVVGCVTLHSACNVFRSSKWSTGRVGLVVSCSGLIISFASMFWTWRGVRLGKRLVQKDLARITAANMIRRSISIGVTINILGIALALVGTQHIVGSLAIKALTQPGGLGGKRRFGRRRAIRLQPLDILVAQGNANTILNHFCSLVAFLCLSRLVRRLDPPSDDGGEHK